MKNKWIWGLLLILLAATAWVLLTKSSGTIREELRDFAVSDTGAIDKIFLADRNGNSSKLERRSSTEWVVNGKFPARSDQINTLLYTIKSLEVKAPVGKNLYNTTMKLMAGTAVKVEIYQKGELVKTYYVGHPTMDNLGTFMYQENSSVPFIMHIPGFNGYLSTRYFAAEAEWKDPVLIRLSPLQLARVRVDNFADQPSSFEVIRNSDTSFVLVRLDDPQTIQVPDPMRLRDYLSAFQGLNYEMLGSGFPAFRRDSLRKAGPFTTLTVADKQGGGTKLDLFRMPLHEASVSRTDAQGKEREFDPDKFFASIPGDTNWYVCQYFHFKKVLVHPNDLVGSR